MNNDLENTLFDSCEKYLLHMFEELNALDIDAFALYTDNEFSSIIPAFNTHAHYVKNANKNPNDKIYYRWSP